MASSGLTSYISLFYGEMNSTDTQIGILTSAGAVMGIIANPFWGIRGDRATSKNHVLLSCLFLATLSVWLLPLFGNSFLLLLAATCIFSFFKTAVNPLSDAISLELASSYDFQFSKVRTAGSLGYAIMSMVAGMLVDIHIFSIFFIYSILIILASLIFLKLPKIKGHQQKHSTVRFMQVLQSPSLRKIYIYVLIISSTFGFFISFHALYSVEQNISVSLLGIGIMIGSFSQFPFMLYFPKFYQKFGIRKIILFAGFVNALRWILYAFALNSYTVLLLWILHGGSFMLLYLCLAEYVHRHISKELKVSGQMMNAIILTGLGHIIGGVFGGIFADFYGYSTIFAAMGILCLIGIVYFYIATLHHTNLTENS